MTDKPQTAQGNTPDIESLGQYRINSRLGQGGMGIVYLATDENLGRPVAIKVLHPHLLKHENLKQRFRREARMHAKLMHPNIVTLLSLYEDDEYMALVMEVVNGEDLKAFLRKNPNLTIKEKLNIAIEILKGLEAAHEFGMVHRDLKPANVLVSKKGEVKLLDFGLAKPEEGGDDLTQSGATVGSFRYMAPEQILNNPIDARTDLYAFGILLFFMLLGKLPFDATSNGGEFEIMEKQVRDPAPKPHEVDASIPLPLSNLILKLLEKNKNNRPENAASVRSEIAKIQEQLQFIGGKPKRQPTKPVKTTTAPSSKPSTLSNSQIAMQWIKFGQRHSQSMIAKIRPKLAQPYGHLALIAFIFVLLGVSSISVLSMAEDNATQKSIAMYSVKEKESIAPPPKQPTPVVKQELATTPVKAEPEPKPTQIEKPKAVEKPKKAKVKPKPKPKPKKKKVRSIAYTVGHTITRSDKSKVSSKGKHEFRGGKHLYFPKLAEKGWFNVFKRGESSIEFERPVSLSKIILRKASVGKADFKHGFVYLEAKAPDSRKWVRLFERKDDDVDIAVTIGNIKKELPLIQAVRIRFKTADPITIGPIDLLK